MPDAEQFDVVQMQNDSMSAYHRNILGRLENSNEVVVFGVGLLWEDDYEGIKKLEKLKELSALR